MKLHNISWWQPFVYSHPIFSAYYNAINNKRRYIVFFLLKLYYTLVNLFEWRLGVTNEELCNSLVVVSLTSYGKRIEEVYLAIESIMHGTIKPNQIVLWLQDDILSKPLPPSLLRLKKRGLSIEFCKDIRSYKKLLPSLSKYPEACIVTVDDDQIYDRDMLFCLLETHSQHPTEICANEVYRITLDDNGRLCYYSDWGVGYIKNDVSIFNFPIGEGGILYPSGSLNKEVFNESVFMNICKYGDDVWFYAMWRLNGNRAVKTKTKDPHGCVSIENPDVKESALKTINVAKGSSLNDKQIKSVFERYNIKFDKNE